MRVSMFKPDEVSSTNLTCSTLAGSGKDFTEGVAVLAVGHLLTYVRPVRFHEKGGSEIRYDSRLPDKASREITVKPYTYYRWSRIA